MENRKPSTRKIFVDKPSLKCKVCEKELFDQEDNGVITLWSRRRTDYENEKEHFEHVFWTCRGHCDSALSAYIRKHNGNLTDGWEDISDVMMPTIFIKGVMSIMNEQRSGVVYSDAFFVRCAHCKCAGYGWR